MIHGHYVFLFDAFIKAAEEAKRRGADTIVRCNADNFHYNTVEGYEDVE